MRIGLGEGHKEVVLPGGVYYNTLPKCKGCRYVEICRGGPCEGKLGGTRGKIVENCRITIDNRELREINNNIKKQVGCEDFCITNINIIDGKSHLLKESSKIALVDFISKYPKLLKHLGKPIQVFLTVDIKEIVCGYKR